MTDLAYDNLRHLKLWRVSWLNPFMVAMVVACALMYAIYCMGIGIPESVIPACFVVVLPFLKKDDFICLGCCCGLFEGLSGFTIVWTLALFVYFLKFGRQIKIRSICWIIVGFVLLETLDCLFINEVNDCNYVSFTWWTIRLLYSAFCINLVADIKPKEIIKVLRIYVVSYMCVIPVMLGRFLNGIGSMQNILAERVRLGGTKDAFGLEHVGGLSFNPNGLAILSIMCLGICLIFLYLHYGRRWLWIGIACFASAVNFMTLSRGGMVMWLAVILIYFVNLKSLKQVLFFSPCFIGTFVVIGFVLYNYSDTFSIMVDNMVGRWFERDITAGRLTLWEQWNDYFFDNPSVWLTGIGVTNVWNIADSVGINNVIHGGIQETYVYWGVIGFILMLGLNWSIYKMAKKVNGGELCKLNFLLMIAIWLQYTKGQYLNGALWYQIIPSCVMVYPFWKHRIHTENRMDK